MPNSSDEENEPFPYIVRLRPFAIRAVVASVVYTADTSGKEDAEAAAYAEEFRRRLFDTLGTLATFPLRFPVAREASFLFPPSVRVMPFRYGGIVWRILYRVLEADENDAPRVEIIAVRHGAQKPLTRAESKDIDAANT